jgi:small subunit ribosomal protein S17
MKKNIGVDVKNKPKEKCEDPLCPFHGTISLHGRIFTGVVVSDKMFERINAVLKFRIYIY